MIVYELHVCKALNFMGKVQFEKVYASGRRVCVCVCICSGIQSEDEIEYNIIKVWTF